MALPGIDKINKNEKFYNRIVLFLALPVLFIFSILFTNERIYGDSAGYMFQVINFETFNIVHNRPASVFVEWLPLLLVKLHAPLQVVLYGFSIGEFAWFLIWYLLFSRVLKAPIYGVGVIMAYVFGLRWNYFNPVSELITAFPFIFLLAWLWQSPPKNKIVWYVAGFVVSMFVLLSHPLYLLLVPALFGYFYVNNLKERRFIFLGIGLLVLVLINYQLLTGYNRMSMEVAQYQLKPLEIVKRFFSIRSIIDLVKAYAGIIVLLSVLVYSLVKNKKFVHLSIVAGFVIGYFGLVAYKYGSHYPDTFEPFERYLFIAPLFICVLAAPYLLQAGKKIKYCVLVLVLWHLFYLGKYGMHVKHRYNVLDNAMANAKQFKAGKVYYRAENYYSIINSPRERGHDWIMAMETLLLSSLNGPQNTSQVFIKNTLPDDFFTYLKQEDYLYDAYGWLHNINTLNPAYMQMQPTQWVEANSDSTQIFDPIKIKYEIPGNIYSIHVNQELKLPIILTNTGAPLYSGMKNQRRGLGYKWDNDEKGTYITPLMCDLYSTLKQEIIIKGPKSTGEHTLRIGYMAEKPDTFIPFGAPLYVEAY